MTKINNVMLYVKDLKVASDWYSSNLGFSEGEHDYEHFIDLLSDGKYVLHLVKSKQSMPLERPIISFDVEDISSTYQSLKENGVEVGSLNRHSNHSEFSFKDCDGNVLLFTKWDEGFNMKY